MALPAVRNLKTLIGWDKLAVAAPEKLAALWQACPFVDEVIALTDPKNVWSCAAQMRVGEFGTAVVLPNSLRVAAEALFAGIPQRLGYRRGGRSLMLTKAVPVPPRNPLRLHQRFYYRDLVAALGAPGDDSFPALKLPKIEKPEPILALCPGAEYGPAKRWQADRFAAAARHFLEKNKWKPVVLGAAGDAHIAADLAGQVPGADNLAGTTSLAEFIALLAQAKLVLCNDSGAMHLASALGVPTVAVFGSTEPQMTGPLGPRTEVLRHHVPCSPCFLRECPLDFGCMTSITPAMAIAAGEALLARK